MIGIAYVQRFVPDRQAQVLGILKNRFCYRPPPILQVLDAIQSIHCLQTWFLQKVFEDVGVLQNGRKPAV